MVSSGTNEKTKFPVYEAVERRFKNTKLPALCYPVGMAAYFTDQMLTFGATETEIIEELRHSIVRRGENQEPTKVDIPLDVAIDGFITNQFWMILAREITDAHIYDEETFFIYMSAYSPYAIWLGMGEEPKKGLCKPPEDREIRTIDL